MEVQLTEYENAAFAVFVILLTQTIRKFDLKFYIPLSKVDLNMKRAQKKDAVLNQKFYFKTQLQNEELDSDDWDETSANEIINGRIMPWILKFLSSCGESSKENQSQILQYLDFVGKRASGQVKTNAKWMRDFVGSHAEYKQDSLVNRRIVFDLCEEISKLEL